MTIDLNIPGRLAYLEINHEDLATAREFWPFLVAPIDKILDKFYAHVGTVPELLQLMKGVDVARVKQAQFKHWERLFNSGPDAGYVEAATRIGTTHARIGLDPKWFNGAYALIARELDKVIEGWAKWSATKRQRIKGAVIKLVFLDMDVICGVYNQLTLEKQAETARKTCEIVKTCEAELSDRANGIVAATEEMTGTARAITEMVQAGRTQAESALSETRSSTERNNILMERASQIVGIVDLIRSIADQTNLLALNAAIEAARAGDAGRGFAVVADEVKKLAQQTAVATTDITAKVEEIQGTVKGVVDAATTVAGQIENVNGSIGTISSSMSEQNVATDEISKNLSALQTMLQNMFRQFTQVATASAQ